MDSKNIPTLTADAVKKAIDGLNMFEDAMKEVLLTLTPDQRLHLRKMSGDDLEMITKCLRGAELFKDHFPANYDLGRYQKIMALYNAIHPVAARFGVTAEKVDDTLMFIRNIMITHAEASYGILKMAGKHDAAAKTLLDDIASHYKGRGKKRPDSK